MHRACYPMYVRIVVSHLRVLTIFEKYVVERFLLHQRSDGYMLPGIRYLPAAVRRPSGA